MNIKLPGRGQQLLTSTLVSLLRFFVIIPHNKENTVIELPIEF